MAAKVKPISELSLSSTSIIDNLVKACDEGRVKELERVLEEGETQEDRTALANRKSQDTGFTPLHRVCHHGHSQCIPVLLKHHADPLIWDRCGLAPIHCAARSNSKECVKLLLKSGVCSANEGSEMGETPLMIACLNGSLDVARYLFEKYGGVPEQDRNGSTILHYASASDSSELLLWLLGIHEFKALMECPNARGHTPLHHACALGCVHSLSALLFHNVNVSSLPLSTRLPVSHSPPTLSPSELAYQYGNKRSYEIVENSATPPPLPKVSTAASFNTERTQSSENILRESHSAAVFIPQRSNSSGSHGSRQSLLSTTATVQRRGSLMGTSRPVTLELRRSSSLKRGSAETLVRKGEEERRAYIQSRSSANRLSHSLSRQSSSSVEQLLYDSTAYEPPPDIIFTQPLVKKVLTYKTRKVYSSEHGLKLRVSQDYWTGETRSHGLHVYMAAGMHYSQSFPQGYTVVGPICFISCRSRGSCRVNLTLPHAISTTHDPNSNSRLVILSSATAKPESNDPQSPFFSPSERELEPLDVLDLRIDKGKVRFETELCHPSLFAVAVRDGPSLLPLRCCLYVLYPVIEPSVTMVTGFDVETYIGMNLQTVATTIMSWAETNNLKLEETHFILSDEEVIVTSNVPSTQTDWEINRRGEGKLSYTQVSLTRYTDRDSYSHHQPVYPHRERFFIEPRAAYSAVKCRVSVYNLSNELCHLLVIPFTPKKETTPDLSSEEHRHSIPLTTEHLPLHRRHSLPSSLSSHGSFRASFHTPSHFPQVLLTQPSPSPPPHSARLATAIPGTSSLSASTIAPRSTSSQITDTTFRPSSSGGTSAATSSSTSPLSSRHTPPPPTNGHSPPYQTSKVRPIQGRSPILHLRLPNGEHQTESQV